MLAKRGTTHRQQKQQQQQQQPPQTKHGSKVIGTLVIRVPGYEHAHVLHVHKREKTTVQTILRRWFHPNSPQRLVNAMPHVQSWMLCCFRDIGRPMPLDRAISLRKLVKEHSMFSMPTWYECVGLLQSEDCVEGNDDEPEEDDGDGEEEEEEDMEEHGTIGNHVDSDRMHWLMRKAQEEADDFDRNEIVKQDLRYDDPRTSSLEAPEILQNKDDDDDDDDDDDGDGDDSTYTSDEDLDEDTISFSRKQPLLERIQAASSNRDRQDTKKETVRRRYEQIVSQAPKHKRTTKR